jgi:hypothetical protein
MLNLFLYTYISTSAIQISILPQIHIQTEMTYSIDKCVKLLGYEYELPDEIILIIQRMVIHEKFRINIRNCMCKIHMGVRIRSRTAGGSHQNFHNFNEYRESPDFYEDGNRSHSINPVRRCLTDPNYNARFRSQHDFLNLYGIFGPNRYIHIIESPCRNLKFMGQDIRSIGGIEMNSILKRDMVEYMKNNGMKFNKSKTKSQLAHIYMNHKNLVEEEPFIYTYKNIKKIKYD